MRTDWSHLDKYRVKHPTHTLYSPAGATYGAFAIPHPTKGRYTYEVIAVDAQDEMSRGWEHVSVKVADISGETRTPGWDEMEWIKALFWQEDEVTVQFHVNGQEKVNVHPNVLHIWRNAKAPFQLPPQIFV
jgi:hypothetical protein